jgi:hypothetical protein
MSILPANGSDNERFEAALLIHGLIRDIYSIRSTLDGGD